MTADKVQATANGQTISVRGWEGGTGGDGRGFELEKAQVQILYALAEADEVALGYKGLYEVLRGSPATRFSRDEALTAAQRERVDEYLAPLYGLDMVQEHADGERPQLTEEGLRLITWLTRRWQGWQTYSEAVRFSHF